MRQVDVQRLSDSLEYGRAKYRLTKVTDPELRKRYEEIVRKYEMREHIEQTIKMMKEKNDARNS